MNFFGKSGNNISIDYSGLEKDSNIISINPYVKNGDNINNKTRNFKKAIMITLASNNLEAMFKSIDFINANLRLVDENGNDLIYEKAQTRTIKNFID